MTLTGPPIWLLDVDGVLNAFGPYSANAKKSARWINPYWDNIKMYNGVAFSNGRGYTIRWAPTLVERINELHDTGAVEIRPCTTWNSDWVEIATLLGLPTDLEPAFPTRGVHWRDITIRKMRAASSIFDSGHPLIWTDDQAVPFTWEPLHALMEAGGRSLLIRPKEALGLLPGDMDAIDLFVQMHAPRPIDPETEEVMP